MLPTQNAVIVAPDPILPGKTALYVFGTAANDVILINLGTVAGDVSVQMNGKSRGTFHPTGRIIVHGLAGNDYIGVSSLITLPAWLYGDDGNDTLWGGGGPNLLMGGAGNDMLWGGKGRSLLIGGAGKDALASGSGDAVLIGGTTNYDANDQALLAIMNEWNSSSNCASRLAHITGAAAGLNGSCLLNSSTVHDDVLSDTLIGSTAYDLFFQGYCDTVGGKKPNHTVLSCH